MNAHLRLTTAALCAVGVAAAAWYLAAPARQKSAIDQIRAVERQANSNAQTVGAALSCTPLEPSLTADRILALLDRAPVDQTHGRLTPGQLAALRTHAADWLFHKFVNSDPVVYRQWMQSQGYTLRSRQDLDTYAIASIFKYATDRELPADAPLATAFDDLWAACREHPKQDWQPVAIADDPDGMAIATGALAVGDAGPQTLNGKLGQDFWRGVSNASTPLWLQMGPPRSELVRDSGPVPMAQVGFVMKMKNGAVVPTVATFVMVPRQNRWRLEWFHRYNYPPAKLGPEAL